MELAGWHGDTLPEIEEAVLLGDLTLCTDADHGDCVTDEGKECETGCLRSCRRIKLMIVAEEAE